MLSKMKSYEYNDFVLKYQVNIYPLIVSRIKNLVDIDLNNSYTILDLGLGPGFLSIFLKKAFPNCKLHGLDINQDMINISKNNIKLEFGSDKKIDYILKPVEKMDFTESYDLIVSYSCIHHWENIELGLKNCYRALKPGGTLLLIDTFPSSVEDLPKLKKELEKKYFYFIQKAYKEAIELSDLKNIIPSSDYEFEELKFFPEDIIYSETYLDYLNSPSFREFKYGSELPSFDNVKSWYIKIKKGE